MSAESTERWRRKQCERLGAWQRKTGEMVFGVVSGGHLVAGATGFDKEIGTGDSRQQSIKQ